MYTMLLDLTYFTNAQIVLQKMSQNRYGFAFLLIISLVLSTGTSCLASYEYQDENGTCQACFYRCLTCTDNTTYCGSCIDQFFLSPTTYQCEPCTRGCARCTSSTSCQLCNKGFYLNPNGTCSLCSVGAATCSISIASECLTGYYMLSGICASCLDNCSKCTGPTTCEECLEGFYLRSGTECVKCDEKCVRCNESGCLGCLTGYMVSGMGCVQCAGTGNMVYSAAENKCIQCMANCQSCDNTSCYYCKAGYYLSADSTNCIQGGSLLCKQSADKGYINCKVDLHGCPSYSVQQYDTSSGRAVPLDVCLPRSFTSTSQFIYGNLANKLCPSSNTVTYTFASLPNYGIKVTSQIRLFDPLPSQITISADNASETLTVPTDISQLPRLTSSCGNYVTWIFNVSLSTYGRTLTYSSRLSLTEVYVQSFLCSVENCQQCTTNVDCVSCVLPYLLQFSKCMKDCDSGLYEYTENRTCHLSCPNGTYPIQSQYKCSSCVGNCLTCNSTTVCLSCKTGFNLYQTSCVTNCTASSLSLYYTDTSTLTCKLCPFPCLTCSSNTTSTNPSCQSCLIGYLYLNKCLLYCPIGTYPSFSGLVVCSSCDSATSFCSSCVVNASICTACVTGYVLYGTTCIMKCPSGYFNRSSVCNVCRMPCLECQFTEYNCTACKAGSLVYIGSLGTCPARCATGTYVNFVNSTNITCSNCSASCSACFGPTNTQCLGCTTGFYLDSTTCSSTCTINTTYANSALNLCKSCQVPCLTCSPINGSACTSCVIGFLDKLLCTLICNSTSYPLINGRMYICTLCPQQCASCQSATICSSCNSPYLLLNTSCVTATNCPAGYYNDTLNLKCPLCSPPCVTCLNSAIKCLSCMAGTYLVEGLSTCVKACPAGYYINGNNCTICSNLCSQCIDTAVKCTKCRIINNAQYYLFNDTCLTTCPAKYYAEPSNTSCAPCVSPCLDCYSLFYCKSCSDTILSLFNKVCVSQCPRGTISTNTTGVRVCQVCTSNCNTCNGTVSNCTSCNANFFFLQNDTINSCLATCPDLFYSDVYTGLCSKCVTPCLTCGSYSSCATCVPGYNLFGTACLIDCPKTYYAKNQVCILCIVPCQRCLNQTTCTLCSTGLLMPYNTTSTSNCLTECVLGQYADNFNRVCQMCPYPCSNCSNVSVCFNCTNGTSLFGTSCLSACPNGYYSDLSVCKACPNGCSVCLTNQSCSRCSSNYFLHNNTCVQTCPSATYASVNLLLSIHTCLSCQSSCLNCTSPYNCTLCQPSLYLQQGFCKMACSSFYYATTNNTCLKCANQYCMTCTNSSNCLACFSSYLYNDSCYTTCPDGSYPMISGMTCGACVGYCKTCSSVYTCTSCVSGYFLYQSSCISKCPVNTWTYIDEGFCAPECKKKKDYTNKYCYNHCPKTMVAEGNTCLLGCPENRYVSKERICEKCTEEMCGDLFKGDLQAVQNDPFQLVLYYNQRAQIVDLRYIRVVISSRWSGFVMFTESDITVSQITDRSIKLTYNFSYLEPAQINLTIPYISSLDSSQSLYTNTFNTTTQIYSNWQGQLSLYYLSAVLSILTLIILVINLFNAKGHYQQIMDFAHIYWVLGYLEIEYPKVLSSFYEGFRVVALHAGFGIAPPYVYSFSPSKYIRYDEDINVLRSCGMIILFGVLLGAIGGVVAILVRVFRDRKDEDNKGLKFIRALHNRIFWRYINDYLFIGIVQMGMFSAATFRNKPNKNTGGAYALSVVSLVVIISLVALIFYVVLKALQKRRASLKQITGLVQDLQTDCSTLGLMHTPILYLRKLILIFVAGLCSSSPVYSLSLLLIASALILVILFFYKPFKDDITDYITIAIQASIVLTLILLIVYRTNSNSFSVDAKTVIGWILVGLNGLMMCVAVGWWGYRTVGDLCRGCSKGEQAKVENEDVTAQHINRQQDNNKSEEAQKPKDKEEIKKAIMDQLRQGDRDPEQPQNEKLSQGSQKEQFHHFDSQSSQNNQAPKLPELLLRRQVSS